MNKSELLEIINFYYNGTCIVFNIFLERQSPFFFFFFLDGDKNHSVKTALYYARPKVSCSTLIFSTLMLI